ncbi:MAG: LapA family protein [Rickettsiella sp.]|nr:LapA family protein [Rickettsiella sp.]
MRILTYLFLFLLVLLALTFAGLNAAPVSINYYLGKIELPLSLLAILSFILGGLLGLLMAFTIYVKLKYANRRLQHRLKLVEKELINLRALPLKDHPH